MFAIYRLMLSPMSTDAFVQKSRSVQNMRVNSREESFQKMITTIINNILNVTKKSLYFLEKK